MIIEDVDVVTFDTPLITLDTATATELQGYAVPYVEVFVLRVAVFLLALDDIL